ncbi:hypothetical protein B0H10DRAFT_1017224 [Mycena sp. CBHHK59/15]|nr:hypothetical protein B0H10DRAFT_1017224 [Mycena sp. CBHHK59/15]
MPLNVADPASLTDRPEGFLIFYANVVDGQMWCSDCRAVDDVVRTTFTAPNAPLAVIVYVGNKPEWKALDNVFRVEPFNIKEIPTIIKLREKKEIGRLVDAEIKTGLPAFLENE